MARVDKRKGHPPLPAEVVDAAKKPPYPPYSYYRELPFDTLGTNGRLNHKGPLPFVPGLATDKKVRCATELCAHRTVEHC